jgi:hypothetical protein
MHLTFFLLLIGLYKLQLSASIHTKRNTFSIIFFADQIGRKAQKTLPGGTKNYIAGIFVKRQKNMDFLDGT